MTTTNTSDTAVIAADSDPWVRIVRDATDADVETYGRDDTLTDWL